MVCHFRPASLSIYLSNYLTIYYFYLFIYLFLSLFLYFCTCIFIYFSVRLLYSRVLVRSPCGLFFCLLLFHARQRCAVVFLISLARHEARGFRQEDRSMD